MTSVALDNNPLILLDKELLRVDVLGLVHSFGRLGVVHIEL